MKQAFLLLLLGVLLTSAKAQLYFPPNNSNNWDTTAPASLGWCQNKIDSLYTLLDSNSTKAFILLKDGKIVLEQYFNGHSESSVWYWASAGKTLTAFMVGIAQQENYLNITDTAATYLGDGWTSCAASQEKQISIRHQLTMTSGLNDGLADPYCTDDTCLQYLADAGTRWAYHNAPYTLLDNVIENATGQTLNLYTSLKLKNTTGMDGLYIPQGYNNVFFSTARSMARFGLLVLNKGNWNGNAVLSDSSYFNEMINTSQNLNKAYGYLWWLNGKSEFMIPQSQFVFSGSMNPNAPNDMISALGKNGQFINIVPSQNMVWIRTGDAPDNSIVPFTFNDKIWEYINDLDCGSLANNQTTDEKLKFVAYPNPVKDIMRLQCSDQLTGSTNYSIINPLGEIIQQGSFNANQTNLKLLTLNSGIYLLVLHNNNYYQSIKFVKE